MREVSQRERNFANLILLGHTAAEAYRQAYGAKGKPKRIGNRASIVRNRPCVVAYIATEQAKASELVGATRAFKRRRLLAIMEDKNADAGRVIASIHEDNLMTGDHKPVRFEGEITLQGIFLALQKTTGLPDPNEVYELNGADPDRPALPP